MASRTLASFTRIVCVNAALKPMEPARLVSPLARLLFANPLTPRIVAWRTRRSDDSRRLLRMTGSPLDAEDLRLYGVLFQDSDHVRGALGMMAGWDLAPLIARLPQLATPTTLVVAADDPMVRPRVSHDAARKMPNAEVRAIPSGGHLLHEVQPDLIDEIVRETCGADLLPSTS